MTPDPTPDELTVAQLRERAAALEIPGRSAMNKVELAAAVEATSGSAAPAPAAEGWQEDNAESFLIAEEAGEPDRALTAPAAGETPADRLARSEPSQLDAMGQDKRRSVIGKSYGPSVGRQALVYGVFLAVVAALFIAASFAVDELDKPDPSRVNTAPWASADAGNEPPAPIDFPRSITP